MLHNYLMQVKFKFRGVKNLLCAHGWAGQAQHHFYRRRISQSEIRNSAAAESEGGQKFSPYGRSPVGMTSPQPPSFLPARASGFVPVARSATISQEFRSKNVRAESYNSTNIKLSDFFPIDSAARCAASYGKMGFPRASRAAKRRFEIPCDFKYLLCPITN